MRFHFWSRVNDPERECADVTNQEQKDNTVFFNLQVDCKAADLSQRAQRGGDQKCMEGEGKVVVTGTLQFTRRVYFSV